MNGYDGHAVEGRVAIVTGASRGLGRAIAAGLLGAGALVVATARTTPRFEGEDGRAAGGRLLALPADVARQADCALVVRRTLDTFGRIDVLFNNAALGMETLVRGGSRPSRFWELDADDYRRFLAVNVDGAFRMAREVVPHILAQGDGRIVNVTTGLPTMQRPGYTPYGPTKAALEASTVAWAADLDGTGVTVNALLPGGPSRTRMILDDPALSLDEAGLVDPEAMVPPAVWLAGTASAGVTGRRFVAARWRTDLPPAEAAAAASDPAGW